VRPQPFAPSRLETRTLPREQRPTQGWILFALFVFGLAIATVGYIGFEVLISLRKVLP